MKTIYILTTGLITPVKIKKIGLNHWTFIKTIDITFNQTTQTTQTTPIIIRKIDFNCETFKQTLYFIIWGQLLNLFKGNSNYIKKENTLTNQHNNNTITIIKKTYCNCNTSLKSQILLRIMSILAEMLTKCISLLHVCWQGSQQSIYKDKYRKNQEQAMSLE